MTYSPTYTFTFAPSQTPSTTFTSTNTYVDTYTNTPTYTATKTFAITLTNTPTLILTPKSESISISRPYPNPGDGTRPVTVKIYYSDSYTVEWSVFTTAFRKIAWGGGLSNGNSFIYWDFHDRDGGKVAGGLYYLRIEISATNRKIQKIYKLLALP